jgi:4-hydroxy-tetrahydrodipicolinate reductase
MDIALIGYGKMGKVIEQIAISRGHQIVAKCNSQSPIEDLDFRKADIAIEFTTPDLAVKHIECCINNNIPIVIGTTAWNDQLPYVKEYVSKHNGALLHASNFSIGVNIFFDINRRLAKLMEPHSSYDASINETHHLQKLDAPSGTAVTLADDMLVENNNFSSWIHQKNEAPNVDKGQIDLTSYRAKDVPGTHVVQYNSEIDSIELKHTAHNRTGFALGSIIAAEWLIGKRGVYTMRDLIK